jgi:hypothetical protein
MASMFSPRENAQGSTSHLPKGDCRYIMLHPEVKGLRCACMGFALNSRIPGSTCDCGHQACYHTPELESGSVERQEIEALRDKINRLEEKLDNEKLFGKTDLVDRLGRLEECFDRSTAETEAHFKNMYRGIGSLWQGVGLLQKRTPYYDDSIERLVDEQERIRYQLEESDDAAMRLEDRVEMLENVSTSTLSRRRRASTPPSLCPEYPTDIRARSEEPPSVARLNARLPWHLVTREENIQSFRERVSSVGSGSQAWTVHISLLPTSAQPFPFEKDTAAYKRCLSRGLHRVVAIPDSDSHSFLTAVSDAFSEILRGRSWEPLVARICDAKELRGLPMLRRLPDALIGNDYNVEFLQKNCAVTDDSGKIIDLYIAMSDDTISWAELKEVSQYMDGLEASWTYEPFLDGPEEYEDEEAIESARPAAGIILSAWSPSTGRVPKRKESEISRTPSFGSSPESEGSRTKIRRHTGVEVMVKRRAEPV